MVWDTFLHTDAAETGYVTGKESLGYLIECDNLDTVMDEGHGFVFRLKLFGRNIRCSPSIWMRSGASDNADSGKNRRS